MTYSAFICFLAALIFMGLPTPGFAAPPETLYPVYDKGWAGYINSRGRMVIKPALRYSVNEFRNIDGLGNENLSEIYESRDGMNTVRENGLYGYMNHRGKIAIKPRFKSALPFNKGIAIVQYADQTWGYIKKDGQPLFPGRFAGISEFAEGRAFVHNTFAKYHNKSWRLINRKGEVIGKLSFRAVKRFSKGLAMVVLKVMRANRGYDYKWGFINRQGRLQFSAKYAGAHSFSEGLASVSSREEGGGFIDKTGRMVIRQQFSTATNFKEGLSVLGFHLSDMSNAQARKYESLYTKRGVWAYMNKKGQIVCKRPYGAAGIFSGGLASVAIPRRSRRGLEFRWYLMDKKCRLKVEVQGAQELKPFSEGLAPVKIKDKWGFINTKGKIIVAPRFDLVSAFTKGVARVCEDVRPGDKYRDSWGEIVIAKSTCRSGKIGYINRRGEFLWKPTYSLFALGLRAQNALELKRYVELGADLNSPDHGTKILSAALKLNDFALIRYMMSKGFNLNRAVAPRQYPLLQAVQVGDFRLVHYFLEWGARFHIPGKFDIFQGIVESRELDGGPEEIKLYRYLIHKGARPDKQDALNFATKKGFFYLSRFLVEQGGDVNRKIRKPVKGMERGTTPLMGAVQGHFRGALTDFLLRKGANINAQDDKGRSPLMWASQVADNKYVLGLLLEKGARVNARDKRGRTALFYGVERGSLENVRVLVRACADVHIKDKQGLSIFSVKSRASYDAGKIKAYFRKGLASDQALCRKN